MGSIDDLVNWNCKIRVDAEHIYATDFSCLYFVFGVNYEDQLRGTDMLVKVNREQ